jgi:predicted RNA binding protein YcfA (HicA-like mRNA interferase family)
MRIPKDIKGKEMLKLVGKHFGYEKTRQVGSHIRATTKENGQHHITIPDHNPIKPGTLEGIIDDIAKHFQISKSEVMQKLFK